MAKNNPKLKAEVRTVTGKKVKNLRKQGILPATIYGKDFEPVSIQVVDKEIEKIFSETGESGLVEIELEGKSIPILFRNPQYHPVLGNLMHVDCYKVNLKEKITTHVPIEFIGESMAVKTGNIMVPVLNEVEVEALPADLPEKIEVDISKLETLESVITVADLVVEKDKVEIKNAADQVIAKVEEPKAEEEPVAAEVAPGDVPATEQKTEEEKTEGKSEDKTEEKEKKEEK